MSDKFYSMNREDAANTGSTITRGVATSAAKHLELRILDGAGVTKQDLDLFFERLENYFFGQQVESLNSTSDVDL